MAINLDPTSRTMDEIAKSSISNLPFRSRDSQSLTTMEERLSKFIDDRAAIASRLRELEGEWSCERVLTAIGSSALLSSFLVGLRTHRKTNWMSAVVGSFMLQHLLQGWCPPMILLRRFGLRSAREIENERIALKALRGDFEGTEDPKITARHVLLATDPSFFH